MMNVPLSRTMVNWSDVEKRMGFSINTNYREFYELLGSMALDDFLYVVGIHPKHGLKSHVDYVMDAYSELKEFLDDDLELMTKWMPVGYTIDAVFIFCNDDSVLLTDGGFETQEIYSGSLVSFIQDILDKKSMFSNLPDDMNEFEHSIRILDKESGTSV